MISFSFMTGVGWQPGQNGNALGSLRAARDTRRSVSRPAHLYCACQGPENDECAGGCCCGRYGREGWPQWARQWIRHLF
jgi:hypothetical protein